jgi:pyridoxal phosphate enzyme (YggS family)
MKELAIADKITAIRGRIAAATARSGRSPDEIRLMAVTKTVDAARIAEAYDAGLRLFGENRVQEFSAKIQSAELRRFPDAEWHLIGHLQSNKTAAAAQLFHAVDSIDSLRIAEKLNSAGEKLSKPLPILLEIKLADEPAKTGFLPESEELEAMLAAAPKLQWLRIAGLMSVPPFHDVAERSRAYFRQLRQLRDRISSQRLPAVAMDELSMGMSHDFEIAVEEGSTCVRIGSAIFGPRPQK